MSDNHETNPPARERTEHDTGYGMVNRLAMKNWESRPINSLPTYKDVALVLQTVGLPAVIALGLLWFGVKDNREDMKMIADQVASNTAAIKASNEVQSSLVAAVKAQNDLQAQSDMTNQSIIWVITSSCINDAQGDQAKVEVCLSRPWHGGRKLR